MRNKGFTLVELLVVISIIAILATISITVFSAAQGNARDGKRRSEISSIAKSIEASKDFTTNLYKYDTTTLGNDFPQNTPSDPLYCVLAKQASNPPAVSDTVPPTKPNAAYVTCPQLGYTINDQLTVAIGRSAFKDGNIASWTICANLERSNTPFCVSSLTK